MSLGATGDFDRTSTHHDSDDVDAIPRGDAVNLALPENGGRLESFTSEYCTPTNAPGDCQSGFWNAANVHDGVHAIGKKPDFKRLGRRASSDKAPEEFVLVGAPMTTTKIRVSLRDGNDVAFWELGEIEVWSRR